MYDSSWHGHALYGMGLGGWLIMLLFWIVVIVGIVALVRWAWGLGPRPRERNKDGRRALKILEERYARGEIDEEEYEKRRRNLS